MYFAPALRHLGALLLTVLLAPLAVGQVTTDYTKTGIPNGTPSAISATTGTGSTMVLQSSPTLNTPTLSIPKLSTQTWANLPAAASNAWALTAASDLGTNGALVVSNGARWKPVNGIAALYSLAAPVTGIANSETIVCQTKLPVNAWQIGDLVRVWLAGTKSGTTNAYNVTVHVGTAGTTSDTLITGFSGFQMMTTAGLTGGDIFDLKLLSATSVQRTGSTSSGQGTWSVGSSAGAIVAATTVTDASANSLYVSVGAMSSGAADTVTVQDCKIQLITP